MEDSNSIKLHKKPSKKPSLHSGHEMQESAAKLKASDDLGDNSQLELVPEEINLRDLFVQVKSRQGISGSEHGLNSPEFNDSKDCNSTVKENDLTAVMRKKNYECPSVILEDSVPVSFLANLKRLGSGENFGMRRRHRQDEATTDIFSKFMAENEESESVAYRFITHSSTQLCFIFVTLYTLFADDYRILVANKNTDTFFDIFTVICLALFLIEIIVYVLFKDGYLFAYHFWLDLISSLSLVLDLRWVNDAMNGSSSKGSSALGGLPLIGRVSRLLRVVRLVRISKLYKTLNIVENKRGTRNDGSQASHSSRDSKVGRMMSAIATKTVIISCFILLILLPLFSVDLYLNDTTSVDPVCQKLKVILELPEAALVFQLKPVFDPSKSSRLFSASSADKYLNFYVGHTLENYASNDFRLVRIDFGEAYTFFKADDFGYLRDEELNSVSCQGSRIDSEGKEVQVKVGVWQDISVQTKVNAVLNVVRTFFICLVVLGGSLWFGRKIHSLMIQPIERMIDKVTQLILKPQLVKEQAFIKQEEEQLAKLENDDSFDDDLSKKDLDQLETVRIESAINKIGILLGVGFGDAGTNLINLYLSKEGEGELLIPGSEIEAIFGFCDIRRFTDVTEVLQEEVMVFVNSIGAIVHSITDKYLGAANKNIGDAFLLAWKPPKAVMDHLNPTRTNLHNVMASLADLSLIAFLKIYCEINKAYSLVTYINDERIRSAVDNNFKVRMGFGLHYGWAIEGAIGSYFKVDVSYLSPNVNMAARLEAATKQYGVSMLISGEFFDLLSVGIKSCCRKVDVVNVKGSDQALRLYSPDITDKALIYPSKPPLKVSMQITKECFAFKKLLINQILAGFNIGPSLFCNDQEIAAVLCFNDPHFRQLFNTGIEAYERGQWRMAKDFLERCLKLQPTDGPSLNIYEFMRSNQFKAPDDWQGVRKLTEK